MILEGQELAKIKTYIGFSKKMGALSYGTSAYSDIKAKRAVIVLIDENASDNTKDKFISLCNGVKVPYVMFPAGELGAAIGKQNVRTVAIRDANLGKKIKIGLVGEN